LLPLTPTPAIVDVVAAAALRIIPTFVAALGGCLLLPAVPLPEWRQRWVFVACGGVGNDASEPEARD